MYLDALEGRGRTSPANGRRDPRTEPGGRPGSGVSLVTGCGGHSSIFGPTEDTVPKFPVRRDVCGRTTGGSRVRRSDPSPVADGTRSVGTDAPTTVGLGVRRRWTRDGSLWRDDRTRTQVHSMDKTRFYGTYTASRDSDRRCMGDEDVEFLGTRGA